MSSFELDLEALDDDQRVAATAPRGPVCILAGAGTGKTRTITYRIAHLVDQGFVSPQRVLAVTFTSKAAGEMRDRLLSMGVTGVQARTFHAAALRQLRYFWPQVAGDLPWRLVDNNSRLFRVPCAMSAWILPKKLCEIFLAKSNGRRPR